MKSNPAFDHVYINDSNNCSTISINLNLPEQNYNHNTLDGGYQGSKEFICKFFERILI